MTPPEFKLSREQRSRVMRGDYRPLFFVDEPPCEKGTTYVLSWVRESRSHVGDGAVAVTPATPLRWLTVTSKSRTEKGWLVAFNVTDERANARFTRRTPPAFDPALMKRDQTDPPTESEINEARLESNYTNSRHTASDEVFGVDDADLDRFTARARKRERDDKVELATSMRIVEAALTDRLKKLPDHSQVDGEIRRARRQVRNALEKLDKQVRSLEKEAA